MAGPTETITSSPANSFRHRHDRLGRRELLLSHAGLRQVGTREPVYAMHVWRMVERRDQRTARPTEDGHGIRPEVGQHAQGICGREVDPDVPRDSGHADKIRSHTECDRERNRVIDPGIHIDH